MVGVIPSLALLSAYPSSGVTKCGCWIWSSGPGPSRPYLDPARIPEEASLK